MSAKTELTTEVDAQVARICDLGCRHVYRVIELLEDGRESEVVENLRPAVRAAVLAELKAVMAVYDAREDGPPCQIG